MAHKFRDGDLASDNGPGARFKAGGTGKKRKAIDSRHPQKCPAERLVPQHDQQCARVTLRRDFFTSLFLDRCTMTVQKCPSFRQSKKFPLPESHGGELRLRTS